jgi:antitoxin component YwqK of YwqJK toxin-antitoxin module
MKYKLTFLFLSAFLNLSSQTVEKFFDFQWKPCDVNEARFYSIITSTDSGYIRNDYFIHEKSLQMSGKYNDLDCNVANGYFRYFHSNGILESEGSFVHGKKNGLWLSFHNNGLMSDSAVYNLDNVTGTRLSWHTNGYISDSTTQNEDGSGVQASWFENGSPSIAGLYSAGRKQHGKWKYYHKNGAISSIEIFKEGKLINKTYFDEEGKSQRDTTTKDRDPVFPGGNSAWNDYILKKIYFPDQYKIVNGDKAVVVISFAINEDGKVVDVFVNTPFYPKFDKIAESAISHSPKWKPAIKHNRKVKFLVMQAVTFAQK